MSIQDQNDVYTYLGTNLNDDITEVDLKNVEDGPEAAEKPAAKVNGLEGDDQIIAMDTDDLAAGDMVGDEWTYVDGQWVYNVDRVVVSDYGQDKSYNDEIWTFDGNDVLLGNGGNDSLYAGAGDDIVNAGNGNDMVLAGNGHDIVNLENGNDYAEAGYGDDVVNAGDGNDVVYGDVKGDNILEGSDTSASTMKDLAATGSWSMVDTYGESSISQSAATVAGETYTITFDLAANLAGGHANGKVEVIWNGDVINTVEVETGAYQTFEIDVVSTGSEGELTFKAVAPEASDTFNFDGPIVSYSATTTIQGQDVDVAAFAAGQTNLYQIIDGQLNVFNVETKEYIAVGDQPNYKINATGFNVEDDLLYGVAKSNGTDSLGNAVSNTDIVMIDGNGETYRVGEGYYSDYVGDFDDNGNLWTFASSLSRVSVVDVDQRDADGNPVITHYKIPTNLFNGRTYDLAYSAKDDSFFAVVAPGSNGGTGRVVKIDVSGIESGGQPKFSEVAITGTLYGDEMESGMAKGAFGAVFLDGEDNLYYGLNKGDHDLNASTGTQGAIFKVNVDWEAGQAYSEFMSVAPTTGSNDGAVDPRSTDAFTEIDADAAVLIRAPELTLVNGGNDTLNGGLGDDEIHGNDGDDVLNGGDGEDALYGDQGNDEIAGGTGNDMASGGLGNDKIRGEAGNDDLSGNDGQDYLHGGSGNDTMDGGAGVDKIVGGSGADVVNGGAGNDHLWGGEWSADGEADTFVFDCGAGKDYVHDFEADIDLIDLTAFGTTFDAVQSVCTDLGWATVIDLQRLESGHDQDRIVLKSVDLIDLSVDTFIL